MFIIDKAARFAIPLSLTLVVLLLGQARADNGHYFPPVSNVLVKEECGSCHLAYPPSLLPAASWQRMMATLQDHFGEDATVDPVSTQKITAYLVDGAADRGGSRYGKRMLRGLASDAAPLRISELPRWIREHREVNPKEWRSKDVRSKANCAACHSDAAQGYFED